MEDGGSILKPSVYLKMTKKRASQIMLELEQKSSQIMQLRQALSNISEHHSNSKRKHNNNMNDVIDLDYGLSSNDKNKLSVTPEIQITDSLSKISHSRTVFVDLNGFYQCWRLIPSDLLFDAILILPKINSQWILNPDKYLNEYSEILWDDVFVKLLQWKYEQGLVFCNDNIIVNKVMVNNKNKDKNQDDDLDIDPFWKYLSNKLIDLEDPVTFKTSNYNPLILTKEFYESQLFHSKYEVTDKEIFSALKDLNKTHRLSEIIQELLFQCNPSLKVVIEYSEDHQNDMNDATAGLLDELSGMSGMSGMSGFGAAVEKIHNNDKISSLPLPTDNPQINGGKPTASDRVIIMTPMDGYDPQPKESKENFGDSEMDDLLDEICAGYSNHHHNNHHNTHMHVEANPYQMVITHANQNNGNHNGLLPPQNPHFAGVGTMGALSFDSMFSMTADSELKFVDYEH